LEYQSEPSTPARICYTTVTPVSVPIYLAPHRGEWRGVERTLLNPVISNPLLAHLLVYTCHTFNPQLIHNFSIHSSFTISIHSSFTIFQSTVRSQFFNHQLVPNFSIHSSFTPSSTARSQFFNPLFVHNFNPQLAHTRARFQSTARSQFSLFSHSFLTLQFQSTTR
jgi:hypothetical protein